VADFMAAMPQNCGASLRILDPAAGAGILLCAVVERLAQLETPPRRIELVAYELDPDFAEPLEAVLDYLRAWAAQFQVVVEITIHRKDFILAEANALAGGNGNRFDIVMANPPYFKIAKEDPRAIAARSVVHGQPNIYGLFMAVGAALLRQGGELVFITPRSFASGPYFRRFRERFFDMVRPYRAHVFASRRMAFSRDDILQESVILHATKDNGWSTREDFGSRVLVSSSHGTANLMRSRKRPVSLSEILSVTDKDRVLRLPTSDEDDELLRLVDDWSGSLHAYQLEISTGPVVPFRATKWLAERKNGVTMPLLWMHHVKPMEIAWPNGSHKPQYILGKPDARSLLLPNQNYVLLRRFSAKEEKRRLTAAPLLARTLEFPLVGLENHLNYIYRPGGNLSEDEAWGLAAIFNSSLLDNYFRCSNGNTQVSATELRSLPLPPFEDVVALGKAMRTARHPTMMIDELMESMMISPARMTREKARAVG
jgi:adenine-specific DNA-methyltransferase